MQRPTIKVSSNSTDTWVMLHVKEIQIIIDEQKASYSEAHDAIDLLLELGPSNTEALKLRALLYGQQGRFAEEAKSWERLIDIDSSDEDAITYFHLRHLEDREHFYFTDDLPDGGQRFIAYPKSLIRNTFYALAGCLSFLMFTRLTLYYPTLEGSFILLPVFALSVMLPWVSTIIAWIKSMRSVSLTKNGFEIATRFKKHVLEWKDVESVYVAHSTGGDDDSLSLILIPITSGHMPIELDLSQTTSSIRARSFLIKKVASTFGEPTHVSRESLSLDESKLVSF